MSTKHLLALLFVVAVLFGLVWIFLEVQIAGLRPNGEYTACTMEAKICPDGSAVGRSGPNCEFAACPEPPIVPVVPEKSPATITAKVGKAVTVLGETITVKRVVSDSRCPVDVQCVWAGDIAIELAVEGGMGVGSLTLSLGKTGTTEASSITFVSVMPEPRASATITEGSYTFTLEVARR